VSSEVKKISHRDTESQRKHNAMGELRSNIMLLPNVRLPRRGVFIPHLCKIEIASATMLPRNDTSCHLWQVYLFRIFLLFRAFMAIFISVSPW